MSAFVSALERELAPWIVSMDRHPLVGAVIRGDASREQYVRFLWSTHHYLRWSGPLLAETAAGLRRSGRYPWLVDVVEAKADEESPHGAWVLDDLAQCGVKAGHVLASPEPHAVSAYAMWGLTMAGEGSPAYLGAAYGLELLSVRRAAMAAANLRARRSIPNISRAVSFLVGHGDADVDHVALLRGLLDRVADTRDQEAIALSAAVLRELYPKFFRPGARGEEVASCESFGA